MAWFLHVVFLDTIIHKSQLYLNEGREKNDIM